MGGGGGEGVCGRQPPRPRGRHPPGPRGRLPHWTQTQTPPRPIGRHPPPDPEAEPPPPIPPPSSRDGHWIGWYASYWNAFLFRYFFENPLKMSKSRKGCELQEGLLKMLHRYWIRIWSTLFSFYFHRTSNVADMAEVTYYVNVCDIDSPWEVHRLTSSQDAIVLMRWDSSATKLLLVTALGECQVWEMKVCINSCEDVNLTFLNFWWKSQWCKF